MKNKNPLILMSEIIEKIEIGQKTLEEIEKKLNLFEERIKISAVGVEIWFDKEDYEYHVGTHSNGKTFEEWFFDRLLNSDK